MGPLVSLLSRIGVQPAERALFGWAGLCLLLVGAAAFALLNAAETLFLKRVGVERLPLALLASSALLVATTTLAGALASAAPTRWLPRILFGLAASLAPFVWLAESQAPLVLGALVLIARQILALGALSFWLAMGSLVPTRRAKQLFAPLAAGITLGGILGSFGSGPLASAIGPGGLIAVCGAALALAAVVARRLRRTGRRQLAGRPRPRARIGERSAGFSELFRSSRLFRLLALTLWCGGALSPILFFEFSTVLDASTRGPDGEQRMLALYSQFRGWLNVAMLLTQLWLSGILYRRIGLPLSLSLWPGAYLLGFGWLGIDFALVAGFGSLGMARLTEDGIGDSASRILYNLFPEEVRARASGLLAGPVNRLGGVLGNGFVLAALAWGTSGWISATALAVAMVWLGSALWLWRVYPTLLLRASAEHGLAGAGVDRATLVDPATLRNLAPVLCDPDPRVSRAALDLVVEGDGATVVRLLAEAVEPSPDAGRPRLVEALQRTVESLPRGEGFSVPATEALGRALRARPPLPAEERADLLQVLARLTAGSDVPPAVAAASRALLERGLGDRAAPVRLAAVAELHVRGVPPPGLPDLDRALDDALAAPDSLVRRAARKELRAILLSSPSGALWSERLDRLASHLAMRADRAETAEALRDVARLHGARTREVARVAMEHVDDRDPRVRGALLSIAGHAGMAEWGPQMVAALGAREPAEADGAREGLVALGAEAALPLLVGLELGGAARREAILAVLQELEVDAATLDALRVRQVEILHETVLERAALEELAGPPAMLLRRRLDESIAEGLGALLAVLAAVHEDPRIAELERQLSRSRGTGHDLFAEALEALLGREERAAVLPLLEANDPRARVVAAARALDRAPPSCEAVLSGLSGSADAGIRRLAIAASLEAAGAIGDARGVASRMDIAVALQDVPAFDRLGTSQLMALSERLQERKVVEGERVYGAGEEGEGLYFVLEGEVELRRGRLLLETVGEGSFFGELSTLDGVPRADDAIATRDARLMRLDRDDLLPLLEDSPGLAIGMAQFLSARVRRLADRLEAASDEAVDP